MALSLAVTSDEAELFRVGPRTPGPHVVGGGARLCHSGLNHNSCLQRIRATVNSQEQKRLLMDLDINMRTVDCFYTVTFYGALFREVGEGLFPATDSSLGQ